MNPTLAMFVFTIKDVFNGLGAVALIAFFGIAILMKRREDRSKNKEKTWQAREES